MSGYAALEVAEPRSSLREGDASYAADPDSPSRLPSRPALPLPGEATLTACWLLGRVPPAALPWRVLRPGRAGRGPGPDIREAVLLGESGVPRAGDVEVHVRASDFRRHGHEDDPRYDGVILHLVWIDDRPLTERGGPVPLASGSAAPTVAIGEAFATDRRRLERAVARGPAGAADRGADGGMAGRPAGDPVDGPAGWCEPCGDAASRLGATEVVARVRQEGERRLAERAWRAARLLAEVGVAEAWAQLLDRALVATAGRRRTDTARLAAERAAITVRLGGDPLGALVRAAQVEGARGGKPRALAALLQAPGIGEARAFELAWNAALPLLIAVAAAYDDLPLARRTAALAAAWPAPRPYGRTRTLAALIDAPPGGTPAGHGEPGASQPTGGGALYAQGLLHLQDLWCRRGGCGVCPLS